MIPVGILAALASSILFGAGDFLGGFASRQRRQAQVLFLTTTAGLAGLAALSVVLAEPLPGWRDALWAALAGSVGVAAIGCLFRGLAMGEAAIVSPVAAVIGAGLPVIVGLFTEGWPGSTVLAGFACSLAGIWLVTRTGRAERNVSRQALAFAVCAGAGFGIFFVALAQVKTTAVFAPLAVAKSAGLLAVLALLAGQRLRLPALNEPATGYALLSGVLDAGANAAYVMARHATRMDVAVVLASLYPAVTVLLSAVFVKERISRGQWVGVALCTAAVALIAMG